MSFLPPLRLLDFSFSGENQVVERGLCGKVFCCIPVFWPLFLPTPISLTFFGMCWFVQLLLSFWVSS